MADPTPPKPRDPKPPSKSAPISAVSPPPSPSPTSQTARDVRHHRGRHPRKDVLGGGMEGWKEDWGIGNGLMVILERRKAMEEGRVYNPEIAVQFCEDGAYHSIIAQIFNNSEENSLVHLAAAACPGSSQATQQTSSGWSKRDYSSSEAAAVSVVPARKARTV
ncbi:hypothetical protein D9611_006030 [Ephemerocybe angulata]|uniref:Uncharacterized protein n=1 Tax=Ephemerocybe angulata TaxID=980116 RepID=A0A8H5FLQ1_9AGAR|nr:hypothetical protein D9611_006030 [Tulosesus angulatus]